MGTLTTDKILQHFVQINPFDAVTILTQQDDSDYWIVQANERAKELFAQQQLERNANLFFEEKLWKQLQSFVGEASDEPQYIFINNQRFAVSIQSILLNHPYIIIVFRNIEHDGSGVFVKQLEVTRHLYFVEQYVDPVISVDLKGDIIYTNIAAARKLIKNNVSIIGESIFSMVDKHYFDDMKHLFKNTIEGHPLGMPECYLSNLLFHNEPLYIKTFPTYWDGRVIGAHFIFKNINELFKDQERHSYLAYQDELTGLYNRRALNEHWANIYDKDDDTNLALILVDLDRFKKFNESLGKQKTDGMLALVSKRFKNLRSDFVEVYRYNGDEFVFVVRYFSKEEVEDLADRIFTLMKEPIMVDEQGYFITLSVGISAMQHDQRIELEDMLHRADQALFFVKKQGRNHYRFYRKEMSQSFPNEALMEAHLRRAIEFNEFTIHFQPQVDLLSGKIESFEALIRWHNRKFGQVPPSQFIPLAESSGIILEIGDWVLDTVCCYLQKWGELGYRQVRIAVNISPRQFKQENFVQKVAALLLKYELDPSCLELEITEGSMTNVEETTEILLDLKRLGVYISVDDFGTGYSSLSYLKTYPIDILKIDQSFIADIERDKKNEAIIKAIIAMSHNLGIEVIAEGVEEHHQEQFLKEHRCKKVQGYLYDKPLPVEQMVAQYLAV